MTAVNQENLLGELVPDVYIRKITLESSGTPIVESNPHIDHDRERQPRKEDNPDSLTVTIDLLMKEKLDNDLIGTWFANQDLSKYLEIKVFQSTDPKVTAILSAGSDFLDLIEPQKNVPVQDLKMKLAATVFEVGSADEVYKILEKKTAFRKQAANKQGVGVTPKITQYKETVDDDGNKVFNVSFQQRFEVKTANPEHLAYFAKTSLNLQALAQDFGIDFDSIGLKAMNGKIASDLVIDDFEIVNQSFTFLDVQGKIWTGFTHTLSNGQYRSGATETTDSFELTRMPVSNTKIQDFRDVKEIERLTLNFNAIENNFLNKNITKVLTNDNMDSERVPVYFSEMSLTRDKDGDAKFFFSVDFDKMIQDKAVFGRLFAAGNERLKMSMLKNTQIRSLRILRQRVKENGSLNQLGSPCGIGVFDQNEALELISHSNEKSWKRFTSTKFSNGTLKEIELVMEEKAPMIRHFTGMDLSMSEVTDGMYRYVVELEIDDATVEFLIDKVRDLLDAKTSLQRYLSEASTPSMSKYLSEVRNPHIEHPSEFAGTQGNTSGAFDVASNRFTQNFIKTQQEKYKGKKRRNAPWVGPLAVYADVLDLFTDALKSTRNRQKLTKSLYSYTSPATGNPNGISTVISLIDRLITSLTDAIGVTITTSPRRYDGFDTSTLQSPILNIGRTTRSTFKITKSFEQLFDSNVVKNVGMDYLSKGEDSTQNDDGLRIIDNSDFKSRVDLETLKYFKSPEPNIDMSFGGEQFTERDSIKATNFSFLSPSRIDFTNKSFILSEGDKTLNSEANLEPGESGVRTDSTKKDRVKRFIIRTDDGLVKREDVATEICTSIFYSNFLSSPATETVSRSIDKGLGKGRSANRGKKKNDKNKINEETIKKTLDNFTSAHSNILIKPIEVEVVKDANDGFTTIKPIRPNQLPDKSYDLISPETDIISESKSQEEENSDVVFLEKASINQFYLSLVKPMMKTGINGVKGEEVTSLISSLNLRELKVVSTSGRPDALRTISGLKKVVTEDQIKRLPNQIKVLFLQSASQNIVRPSKILGLSSTDAVTKTKFAAMNSLDFEMIAQIEYLSGFNKNEDGDVLIREPIWKILTAEKNEELVGKDILCRTRSYENSFLGVYPNKGMKTGIYDEYFILRPKTSGKNTIEIDSESSIETELISMDSQTGDVEDEYLSNNIVAQNEFENEITIPPPEEKVDYITILKRRAGVDFVLALNPSEAQAKELVGAISPGAATETAVQLSLVSTLERMGLLGSNSNTSTRTVDAKPSKTTIADLVKKSRS